MRLNSTFFLYIFFLLLFGSIQAQQKRLPLRDLLSTLENHYQVSFTYSDENIEHVSIDPLPSNISLAEVLTFLSKKTGLIFTQLDERFITISKPSAATTVRVCGTIVDPETNEKIVGATIQSNGRYAVSNTAGYFEFTNLTSGASLILKSVGYETKRINVDSLAGKPCEVIFLTLSTSYLSEVIITNYLTNGIRKKVDGSFAIQTSTLGILPGLTEPDVLFTIQALPGIQSIDETVSNINVRGGTHDQNLVLWDGMKMYQQGHFFGLISVFNPYVADEVNLVKNGTSALYSDGVSSTIDIHSDDDITPNFAGGVGINMIDMNVVTKIPISKKVSLNLSGRHSINNVIQTPTYKAYYERAFRGTDVISNTNDSLQTSEQFNFFDIGAKMLYDISEKDKLRVSFLQVYNQIEYDETEMVSGLPETKTSSLEQENFAGGISYSRLWNTKFRTTGQWYVSKYELSATNNDILNDQELIQENNVLDMGIKLDARFSISKNFDLFIGYQFFEVGVTNLEDINTPPYYRLKKTVLRTHVLFAEAGYISPTAQTNIRAGLRANYFTKFSRIRLEPRFSFSQKIQEALTLEVQGEMKSQTTTQIIDFQNDFLGVEKRRWVMANEDDIPISTSKQLSVGLHYQKRNLLISFEGYGKWVDDIITSTQGFQNQFQYVRATGNYETSGIDFLINKRISKWNTWFSYSYAISTYKFPDLIPQSFPNNLDIRHRATAGISFQSDHLDISCGANWRTGKPYTEPSENNSVLNGKIQYQSPNSTRLENYWRVDLSANYTFDFTTRVKGVVGFSIWNLFNHDNIIDAYYTFDQENQIILSQRKALPFTPNLMVRVDF